MIISSADDAYEHLKKSPEWTSRVDLNHPKGITVQPFSDSTTGMDLWRTRVWIEERLLIFSVDSFGNVLVTEKIGVPAGADS